MRLVALFSTCLVILCSVCFAQNKTNEHGLKYGFWKEGNQEGFYKIIPFSMYDTVGSVSGRFLDVRYGRHCGIHSVSVDSYYKDSLSVKDGWQKSFDEYGMYSMTEYHDGISGNVIAFKKDNEFSKRDTFYYYYLRHDIDSFWIDNYYNNRVQHRHDLAGTNNVYYPNDSLILSQIFLNSKVILQKSRHDTITFYLSSKNEQVVKSINYDNCLQLLTDKFNTVKFPITINKGDTLFFKIINTQHANNIFDFNPITIKTANGLDYGLELRTEVSQLDYMNFLDVDTMTLSRKNDGYLRIDGESLEVAHVYIDYGKKEILKQWYDTYKDSEYCLMVDISRLPKKMYTMNVYCKPFYKKGIYKTMQLKIID